MVAFDSFNDAINWYLSRKKCEENCGACCVLVLISDELGYSIFTFGEETFG